MKTRTMFGWSWACAAGRKKRSAHASASPTVVVHLVDSERTFIFVLIGTFLVSSRARPLPARPRRFAGDRVEAYGVYQMGEV
jgi:hypothetical protein